MIIPVSNGKNSSVQNIMYIGIIMNFLRIWNINIQDIGQTNEIMLPCIKLNIYKFLKITQNVLIKQSAPNIFYATHFITGSQYRYILFPNQIERNLMNNKITFNNNNN